jgi:hypothetical protein
MLPEHAISKRQIATVPELMYRDGASDGQQHPVWLNIGFSPQSNQRYNCTNVLICPLEVSKDLQSSGAYRQELKEDYPARQW